MTSKLSTKNERKSNIELLRIIAMIMILVLHTRYDGILANYDGIIDIPHICKFIFESLAIVGVNLFVLISGYFGIHIKVKSVCNLIFQVYFFAIVGLLGWWIMEGGIETKFIVKTILPLSHTVWFIPSYIMLMIFSPILNSYLENHSLRHITILTISIYIVSYFWGTIITGTIGGFGGYNWGWFVILYLSGSIIRKYTEQHKINRSIVLGGYLICTLLLVIISLAQNYVPIGQSLIWNYDFPIVYLSSICLFIFFANLEIKHNRIINWLAASAFAVLLYHVAPFSKYNDCCKYIYEHYSSITCITMTGIFVLVTYITATTIDQLRIFLFKKIYK